MRFSRMLTALCLTMLVVALTTTGCSKKVAAVTPPPPAPAPQEPAAPPKAPTASLAAEPETIERGQSATLVWSSTESTQLEISGLGPVEASGRQQVQPAESTTYTLTAKGPGGSASATASITVTIPPPPPPPAPPRETKSFTQRLDELADVYFDFDRSDVRADARESLTQHAEELRSILAEFPDAVLTLEGHCDERGSAEYNLALGDRRATSTNAFLEALGIQTARLKQISYGKEKPQCTDSDEECWQRNRRVHFAGSTN